MILWRLKWVGLTGRWLTFELCVCASYPWQWKQRIQCSIILNLKGMLKRPVILIGLKALENARQVWIGKVE